MTFISKGLSFLLATVLSLTFMTSAFAETNNEEDATMIRVDITIGEQIFEALFYDNITANAFIGQMPLMLDMSDLHRNEKFFDLPENLPIDGTERPSTIHAGEIMVWSSNTIVLFYDTFRNSYGGYVKLGRINDFTGLKEAVGSRNVSVTFSIPE